jgi:hypothetical protein
MDLLFNVVWQLRYLLLILIAVKVLFSVVRAFAKARKHL